MSLSRRVLFASAAGLAAGNTARAADPAPYVTAEQLDLTVLLPPPPAAGGPVQAREVGEVIEAQGAASPERIAQAVRDAAETVFVMFAPVLGERFEARRLPLTAAMFARIGASEDATVDPAKPFFGRVRPFLADARISALVPASRSGSWPSGHVTRSTAMAAVLVSVLPGGRDTPRRAAIWARTADYGQSRVIGGMHYPSDLLAGQRAGSAMAAALLASPAVLADAGPVRDELRAAFG